MNYTYDIVLNYSKDIIYDFYEWKKEDSLEFILKIPTFKVENNIIYDFINNDFIISKDFLMKLFDKTEVYTKTSIKLIKYRALFVSEEKAISIEFDEDGKSQMKSFLSIDEENDVINASKKYKYSIFDYEIINKNIINSNDILTRKELKQKIEIEKKINDIYLNKDYSKLRYIYYELFKEKEENDLNIYYKIINSINNNISKVYTLIDIFNMIDNKIGI